MKTARIRITNAAGQRDVALATYLDAAGDEQAVAAAYAWIKALRHLDVDGEPLRRRFTFRGDSLWWFAELYLHKTEVVRELFRITTALEQLVARERPTELAVTSGSHVVRGVAGQVARAHAVRYAADDGFGSTSRRLARLTRRATALTWTALASRLRPRRRRPGAVQVAAFVHRAFWKGEGSDGSAESYIGPVLDALEHRLPKYAIRYIAVGPASNFAARRWWHPLRQADAFGGIEAIEAFASLRALGPSRHLWRQRHTFLHALWNSTAIREHAIVRGIDWWPVIREELAGVALLQFPWSARAMDEAGAALDALGARVALTYAEAGGWGRAIMLEARRRAVTSVGLQHGFIYRHWLNYLHEPDEMIPDGADRGFPRPDLTLLFDGYAAEHLATKGHFPVEACLVTGSPRLDALVAATRELPAAAIDAARRDAGASGNQALVLLVTKLREARHALPSLIAAVGDMPGVQLAIKTHPAETPDVYAALAAGAANVRVLPAGAPLAPLLAAARAVVTVNSTVALDGAVLGIPALVIGLPNNLSPFVEAGAMAGANDEEIGPVLSRILYDERFRQELGASRSVFLARYGIGSDGFAAERSAGAIVSRLPPQG
jgi:hypothetical protein